MGDTLARCAARHAWLIALLALRAGLCSRVRWTTTRATATSAAAPESIERSSARVVGGGPPRARRAARPSSCRGRRPESSAEGESSAAATARRRASRSSSAVRSRRPARPASPTTRTAGTASRWPWRRSTRRAAPTAGRIALEVTDIDMLTPEGTQSSFQALVDKNVDAIVSPFSITWQPGIDVTAAAGIPYLSGGTSSPAIAYARTDPEKFWNFVSDPAELNYGVGFIQSLDLLIGVGHLDAEEQQGRHRRRRLRVQHAHRRRHQAGDRGLRRQVGARRGLGRRRAASPTGRRSCRSCRSPTPA